MCAEAALLLSRPSSVEAALEPAAAVPLGAWDVAAFVYDARRADSFSAAHVRLLEVAEAAGTQLACTFVALNAASTNPVRPIAPARRSRPEPRGWVLLPA